jgi:hypothetical protein
MQYSDSEVLTTARLNRMLLDKSAEVDAALEEYRAALADFATKDRDARKARAFVLIQTRDRYPKATVAVIEAYVDTDEDIRPVLDAAAQALARKEIAKAALQARMAQLSVAQSMASTAREEMRLAR